MLYRVKNAVENHDRDVFWVDWNMVYRDGFEFVVALDDESAADAEALRLVEKMQQEDDLRALETGLAHAGDQQKEEDFRKALKANRPVYRDHLFRVDESGREMPVSVLAAVVVPRTICSKKPIPYECAKHVVIDIETLGVRVPSPILSIGIAVLDCTKGLPGDITLDAISVNPRQCRGAPETETVLWWTKQKESVRELAFSQEPDEHPFERFADIMKEVNPDYVWGKSPDFDLGHLSAQLRAKSISVPWKFWQQRDIRTIEGLSLSVGDFTVTPEELPAGMCEPHVAVYDALIEAKHLQATLKVLAELKKSGDGHDATE